MRESLQGTTPHVSLKPRSPMWEQGWNAHFPFPSPPGVCPLPVLWDSDWPGTGVMRWRLGSVSCRVGLKAGGRTGWRGEQVRNEAPWGTQLKGPRHLCPSPLGGPPPPSPGRSHLISKSQEKWMCFLSCQMAKKRCSFFAGRLGGIFSIHLRDRFHSDI